MRQHRTAARSLALLLVALALTACAGEKRVEPVPAEEVAERVADAVDGEVGRRPVVACPAELPAEVGAEVVCDLTTEADPETIYPATATVTSVDTSTGEVKLDVAVADAPSGSEG